MHSRFIRSALVTVLIVVSSTTAHAATTGIDRIFSDVSDLSNDLRDAVLQLLVLNTVQGYDDGTFRPQAEISRKEFLKLVTVPVLRAMDKDDIQAAVRSGDLVDIIHHAEEERLLDSGLADADLSLPITRAEAVLAVAAAYDLEPDDDIDETHFVDIEPQDSEFALLVETLAELEIISGRDALHFVPNGRLTRAEAAKIAYRAERALSEEEDDDDDDDRNSISVSSSGVRIISAVPQSVLAGQSATILFTVTSGRGNPVTGLDFISDLDVSITRGGAEVTSTAEIGSGLYSARIATPKSAPAGKICVRVIHLSSPTNPSDSTCDEDSSGDDDTDGGTAVREPTALVRLVPSTLSVGESGIIIATPRSHRGSPVSGLTLVAQVVRGAVRVTEQMTEDPPGTGVYIGKVQAEDVASEDVQIRVRIDDSSSGQYATINTSVKY